MSRRLLVVLIAVFCLGGCTSTEQVTSIQPGTEAVHDIESESRDQSAMLTLASGRAVPVARVTLEPDSTWWVHPSTQNRHVTPTPCISNIRFARHGRGLLEGFGVGLGASLIAGLITVAVPSAAGACEGLAALACGFAGMAVTVGGTVVGTVVGATRGHRDVYHFADVAPASSAECRAHPPVDSATSRQEE